MEIKVITESEVSQEFLQGMANRMEVSYHKYGKVADAKGKIDEIACLEKRLALYKQTGNTEWLIDAANFAMIEFMHKRDNFRPTDSDESPGIVLNSGQSIHTNHSSPESFYKRKGD